MRPEPVEMHAHPAQRRVGQTLRRMALAGAMAAALAGAGCSHASPGVVAYVGDTAISQQQLDDALGGVRQTLQEGQQVSTSAVVNVMVHGVLAEQIAAAHHLQITDAQRDSVISQSNLAGLLAIPSAKPVAYDVADAQIVSNALGMDAYQSEAKQRKVTLNPRFGVLDPAQQAIVEDSSGSLSSPAAASQPAG